MISTNYELEPIMKQLNAESVQSRRLRECPAMYRGQYAKAIAGKASPMHAIKVMCYACMGWEGTAGDGSLKDEVRRCTSPACPLYSYRPGGAKGLSIDAPDASEGEKGTLVRPDDSDAGKTTTVAQTSTGSGSVLSMSSVDGIAAAGQTEATP